MMKKRILCLVLALCTLLVLSGCQEKEVFPTELPEKQSQAQEVIPEEVMPQEQNLFGTEGNNSIPEDFDDGSYDPASEEGGDREAVPDVPVQVDVVLTPAPEYPNTGATPVPIDPIDQPTPTPLPALTFAYQTYTAGSLHLTFEAPAGWIADESQPDSFSLTNPDVSMAYAANLTVRAVPVNKNYGKNDLTKELKGMMDTLASSGLKNWDPSNTANRTFLNSTGVYANYKAATADGELIAGRIIVCCVNKTLYTLHVTYPRGYTETYVDKVFDQFRHTVKITE